MLSSVHKKSVKTMFRSFSQSSLNILDEKKIKVVEWSDVVESNNMIETFINT